MKRKILSILTVVLLLISLCSCGKGAMSSDRVSESYTDDYYSSDYDQAGISGKLNEYTENSHNMTESGRKIIYTANLEIETLNYDSSVKALNEMLSACGGYISSSESYGGESYSSERTNRRLYITLKIPAENYNEFLSAKDSIGNVTSCSETTDDITTQYVDTQARLDTLKAQETRLLALIDKADSVDELLMIESELSNVRYEIETYTSQMQTYDNLISYCTVNISLREANEYSKVSSGFGYKLIQALRSSWIALLNFLQDVIIWFVQILPFCILFGIIGLLIYKRIKRNRTKKYEKYKSDCDVNNQNSEENAQEELTK